MDVQTLVQQAKQGDYSAYERLVTHYASLAGKRAKAVASRHRSVDALELESSLVWAFQRCYESYDPSVGPFEHLVNRSWTHEISRALRQAIRYNSINAMPLDTPSGSMDNDRLAIDVSVDVEADLLADLAVLEYRRRARQEDVTLEKVVIMLALGGFTYAEIAYACGFTGSEEAAKMWTLRAIDRLRKLFIDVGATVRVRMPGTTYHGQTGKVIRHCTERNYTHVVMLADGRVRAFRANELELVS